MNIVFWNKLSADKKTDILQRCNLANDNLELKKNVADILKRVRKDGDDAIKYYTGTFDKVKLSQIELNIVNDIDLPQQTKNAIKLAYKNINEFHKKEFPKIISVKKEGRKIWRKWTPIESVGLYIPNGSAPLVSTMLMALIPAKIAGCKNIVIATPPNKDGSVNPSILYVAKLCGIKKIYRVGGAQAIGAMAFGTKTIQKVSKIFGPGNKYVMEAKMQVSQMQDGASLDMPAGPSEVLVIADETANPLFTASDLLAQAEHDVDARSVLVTTSKEFAIKVKNEVEKQIQKLSRKDIAEKSIEKAVIIIVDNIKEAFEISNDYAPEHLMLQIKDVNKYLDLIVNAGSVFIGDYSSEALGDYISGTNHILPTSGYAKMYSGVCVESFMKSITFQEISKSGMLKLADSLEVLADVEGLDAHKNSVLIRK